MSGITRRGFLQLAAGAFALRCVLRLSAEEGQRRGHRIPHPQHALSLGEDTFLTTWVSEGGLSRLSVVDPSGMRDWARTGSTEGALLHPQGLCRDSDGNAYVCDSRNGRIAAFDAEGKFVRSIGRTGFLPGQFHLPQGCAFGGGKLAVADTQNHRVQILDLEEGDAVVRTIGQLGDGDGDLRRPADVAFEGDDRIWVLDSGHGRAVQYDLEGRRLAQVAVPVGAQGFALDAAGLVVSDTRHGRVTLIDRVGKTLFSIEGLSSPRGVCRLKDAIAVCESGGDLISVFEQR